MKDYLVEVKIKNNYLFSKMKENNIKSVAELCKLSNTHTGLVGKLANLKITPFNKRGTIRSWLIRVSDMLNCDPLDLFPTQHIEKALLTNEAVIEANLVDIESMSFLEDEQSPFSLLENFTNEELKTKMNSLLCKLPPREHRLIELRYGLNGNEEHTFEECGKLLNIGRTRVRQIEDKVVRRLRQPHISKTVQDYYVQ